MSKDPTGTHILLQRAAIASVSVAVVLICGKLVAWLLTGSLSVMASVVDSLMDVAASSINLVAIRFSLNPADAEHRFGHGKAEYLAGLAQASFIAGSAFFLVINSADRIVNPAPITQITSGLVIMAISIAITVLLLLYQHHVIKKTNSTAIRADALHYATDVLTNLATIAALILAWYGWPGLDPIFAIAIACYIFYSACKIGYEAVQKLMDRELPPEIREQIVRIARSPPQVRGIHDLRTRQSGRTMMIQLHLEIDDQLPLLKAHGLARAVEKDILRVWPESDVTIHLDPVEFTRKTTSRPLEP